MIRPRKYGKKSVEVKGIRHKGRDWYKVTLEDATASEEQQWIRSDSTFKSKLEDEELFLDISKSNEVGCSKSKTKWTIIRAFGSSWLNER